MQYLLLLYYSSILSLFLGVRLLFPLLHGFLLNILHDSLITYRMVKIIRDRFQKQLWMLPETSAKTRGNDQAIDMANNSFHPHQAHSTLGQPEASTNYPSLPKSTSDSSTGCFEHINSLLENVEIDELSGKHVTACPVDEKKSKASSRDFISYQQSRRRRQRTIQAIRKKREWRQNLRSFITAWSLSLLNPDMHSRVVRAQAQLRILERWYRYDKPPECKDVERVTKWAQENIDKIETYVKELIDRLTAQKERFFRLQFGKMKDGTGKRWDEFEEHFLYPKEKRAEEKEIMYLSRYDDKFDGLIMKAKERPGSLFRENSEQDDEVHRDDEAYEDIRSESDEAYEDIRSESPTELHLTDGDSINFEVRISDSQRQGNVTALQRLLVLSTSLGPKPTHHLAGMTLLLLNMVVRSLEAAKV